MSMFGHLKNLKSVDCQSLYWLLKFFDVGELAEYSKHELKIDIGKVNGYIFMTQDTSEITFEFNKMYWATKKYL